MTLKVNGKIVKLDSPITIQRLLEHFQVTQSKGIAVAVNYSVVPRAQFEKKELKEGDAVEIIRAVQGG